MKDFKDLNIVEISDAIRTEKVKAVEVAQYFINLAEKDQNNTFITKNFENALKNAKMIDNIKKEEKQKYKLIGVPFVAKDCFITKDVRTTCGSKILEDFVPKYQSTIVDRIMNEYGILIGKANQDEFCMGSSGCTSAFGTAINSLKDKRFPDKRISAGGSSSGSVVSVLNNYSTFSIGTDTGGSVKEPASFCGIYGFRPTYGLLSRYGIISYASSLDQAGIFAKNIEDISIVFDIIKGYDKKDGSMSKFEIQDTYTNLNNFNPKDFTVGIPQGKAFDKLSDFARKSWNEAINQFKNAGVKIIECEIEYAEHAIEVYSILTTAEAFSNLSRFDGIRFGHKSTNVKDLEEMYLNNRSKFGEEVKRRITLGSLCLSSDFYEKAYLKAAKIRRMIHDSYQRNFKKCDLILTPTVASVAFSLDDKLKQEDMWMIDFLTLPPNLAGLGGISVPFSIDEKSNLPLGMQIVSNKFEDIKMLQGAKILMNN